MLGCWGPAVKLEPLGTATGKLVDPDGKPLAGAKVFGSHQVRASIGRQFPGLLALSQGGQSSVDILTATDAEGRFRVSNLIPGFTYNLDARMGERDFLGWVATNVTAALGSEAQDLGTITLTVKKPEPKNP